MKGAPGLADRLRPLPRADRSDSPDAAQEDRVTVNGDGVQHDVVFPDFKAATDKVNRKDASSRTSARCPVTARPAWRARSWWGPTVAALPPGSERCPRSRGPARPLPAGSHRTVSAAPHLRGRYRDLQLDVVASYANRSARVANICAQASE